MAVWFGKGGFVEIGSGCEVWEFMGWLAFEIWQGSVWGECLKVY